MATPASWAHLSVPCKTPQIRSTCSATLTSTAVPNVTRFYDSGKVACQEVVDARVWLGIHFRSADVHGERMGEQVAEWALDRYFRPVSSPQS